MYKFGINSIIAVTVQVVQYIVTKIVSDANYNLLMRKLQCNIYDTCMIYVKVNVVFYASESPRGKSTTTVCGFNNYQLLAVMLLK